MDNTCTGRKQLGDPVTQTTKNKTTGSWLDNVFLEFQQDNLQSNLVGGQPMAFLPKTSYNYSNFL